MSDYIIVLETKEGIKYPHTVKEKDRENYEKYKYRLFGNDEILEEGVSMNEANELLGRKV